MRVVVVATLVALGAVATAAGSVSSPSPFVRCADIIGQARTAHDSGYRLVLGVMSVPPAYQQQGAVRVSDSGRWRYWHKSGMVVRGGNFTVTVSVPKAWRSSAAITWGNNDLPPVSSLRFTGCGNGALTNEWNAYAGGFFLRTASACVPLTFRLGHRTATVRFGIGKRCR